MSFLNHQLHIGRIDAYIDPMEPRDLAIITHGHADHARYGHKRVIATHETIEIMKVRYGENCAESFEPLALRETRRIGDVDVTLYPAGHVLGSAQVLLEHNGERIVVTGDYKRGSDSTCEDLHGAQEKLCAFYQEHGVDLGDLRKATLDHKGEFEGAVVIAPPSALKDKWSRRFPDPVVCMASGWMQVKQRARQRGCELPLVISDHADWNELLDTVRDCGASKIWVTHGREDALVYECQRMGLEAEPLSIQGRDMEGEE